MKYLVLVAVLLSPLSAMAADKGPLVVDMTKVLIDDGKPIPDPYFLTKEDPSCDKCAPLTLGHAAAHALLQFYPDERDLDAEQKWARDVLADRIKNQSAAALTLDETKLIKRLIGKMYGVAVVGSAFPLLDPNAVPPAIK